MKSLFIFIASTFFVKAILAIVVSSLFIMSSSEIYVRCVSFFKELWAQDMSYSRYHNHDEFSLEVEWIE